MSKVATKKVKVPVDPSNPPVKKSRAKKPPPTKDEVLKGIDDHITELGSIITELKDEQVKLPSLALKHIPMLVEETLKNLEDDVKQICEHKKQVTESA